MENKIRNEAIQVFTTVRRVEGEVNYARKIVEYFNANELHGFSGVLIFQNNSNDIEPWVIAQDLLIRSRYQSPFIAVNPIYVHPYTVAQKIASYAKLYKRKVYLNFIAGTSISDMESLHEFLSHNDRYERLIEYITIIRQLLTSRNPVTYEGKYYKVSNILPCTVGADMQPEYFIAGGSENAKTARTKSGSRRIEMAKPLVKMQADATAPLALHFGVMTAATTAEAEQKLKTALGLQYPEVEEYLQLSMSNTDAVWKKEMLSETEDEVYKLKLFKNLNADCPYLIGSYDQVAAYMNEYIARGANTFVIEADENELAGLRAVIDTVKSAFKEIVL